MNAFRNEPRRSALSAGICNASIILYIIWLLLPMVQTAGRAAAGVAVCGLFALGVLLDLEYLRRHWLGMGVRAVCALALPLCMRLFMGRGGDNFLGFYIQAVMLWLPICYCGYARERGDARLTRFVKLTMLGAVTLTTLTTIGWLIEGMLRGGRVYAYSRSLGFAGGEENAAYLKELMQRNIGGYDFIYASVVSLPFTMIAIQRHRGKARAGYSALLAAQTVMIVLSQYTYAMVYTACLLAVELTALTARALSKGRIKMGASLLIGLVPIAAVLLLREPLVALAASLCSKAGLTNFAFSLEQLLTAIRGGVTSDTSRLAYYMLPLEGIGRSPLVGSMLGGERLLSQHSDLLDLLSGMGIIGAAGFGAMVWLTGRGCLRGIRTSRDRAQLCVSGILLAAIAALGTIVYSRDIFSAVGIGLMLVLWDGGAGTEDRA